MVTSAHEGSHRIFQERPEILAPVFATLNIPFPGKATVDALTPDVTETRPLERRIDTLLLVGPSDGNDFLLAVEAQGRRDTKKELSWAYYVAYLQSKYTLPVLLLVVCQNRATAKWATGPFSCGTQDWTTQRTYPLVVGPDNLPVITDERTARAKPALAAIAALAHANHAQIGAILEALGRALQSMDREAATYFYEFLDINLGDTPARATWRQVMSVASYFPGRGTDRETAYLEGEAKGEAKFVLLALEERGISVTDAVRERILACTEPDVLTRWFRRSLTATAAEDLFAEATEATEAPVAHPDRT
ncbi:hypothetical protein [Streptomyces apocyni]|uniref:hypothetical protein n=1 Tax=Streptomyces apocyni TaxID=2654677 RepID=UPI0012EADDA3|nr:hypothetical protein [Streptomyces apocyni]